MGNIRVFEDKKARNDPGEITLLGVTLGIDA
jgi:hypothetical protein